MEVRLHGGNEKAVEKEFQAITFQQDCYGEGKRSSRGSLFLWQLLDFIGLLSEDKTEMKDYKFLCLLILSFILLLPAAAFSDNLTFTVKKGDTLYSIGRTYDVSVQELIQANGIVNPRALKKDMEITVPRTHVVERGDTLYGIARQNGISVEELSTYNSISQNTIIKIGQVLILPDDAIPSEDYSGGDDAGRLVGAGETQDGEAEESAAVENLTTPVRYDTATDNQNLIWPHSGTRSSLNGKLKGTEILGTRGDRVLSVSSGEVVWVAPYRGYGTLVMVESGDDHIYAYGGNETTYVRVGDEVNSGTVLGSLGINPVEKKAKVFFFVYKDGKPVDPARAPRG